MTDTKRLGSEIATSADQTNQSLPTIESTGSDDLAALHAEVARLRSLLGGDEESYQKLRMELWAARDLVMGLDAEAGNLRGRCRMLERDVEHRERELRKMRDSRLPAGGSATLLASARRRAVALRDLRR